MKYRLKCSSKAVVRGTLEVEAASLEAAQKEGELRRGDVVWTYDGSDDEDFEIDSVEEIR